MNGDPSSAPGKLVCREQYGSTSRKHDYRLAKQNGMLEKVNVSKNFNSLFHIFWAVFLPQGYPDTVSEDYLSYQIWDTVQAFASSIVGTLASHAVLKGVGVGDETATVLGASLTWLYKDGAGMLGRILFAWAKGTALDCEAKRWRLFADFLNDLAFFIDIISPLFGTYFTLVVCVSGIFRSIVGVAGGATRAALTQHQARRNNMADVSAKDGSQETLVNLVALLCSIAMVKFVTGHQIVVWVLFVVFTSLHLYANYRAVRAVRMETLSQARLHYLAQHYFIHQKVLDVATVNRLEPVVFPVRRPLKIRLGVSLGDLTRSLSFPGLMEVYERSMTGYLLGVDYKRGSVDIVLSQAADTLDQIQACLHSELLNFILDQINQGKELGENLKHLGNLVQDSRKAGQDTEDKLKSVLATSLHFVESSMSSLTRELHSQGWVTEMAYLGADEWRALWDDQELQHDKKDN
ncbi:UPF0420 protein C16orf58-like protein [Elysia marginata]|uniref:UPF0420 protein C16orf58-like protein n=1 Tax=Elysia marginata TaxID=1093978 RepID=A0AAV4IMK9_9GAST|nr:UPF0420 protein C16orf58-like protein [Elysia marginata]